MPTLLAASQKFGRPYVLLRHFSGDYFNSSIVRVFPAPFPNALRSDGDSFPFAVEQRGQHQAQFIYRKTVNDGAEVDGMAWKGVCGVQAMEFRRQRAMVEKGLRSGSAGWLEFGKSCEVKCLPTHDLCSRETWHCIWGLPSLLCKGLLTNYLATFGIQNWFKKNW